MPEGPDFSNLNSELREMVREQNAAACAVERDREAQPIRCLDDEPAETPEYIGKHSPEHFKGLSLGRYSYFDAATREVTTFSIAH